MPHQRPLHLTFPYCLDRHPAGSAPAANVSVATCRQAVARKKSSRSRPSPSTRPRAESCGLRRRSNRPNGSTARAGASSRARGSPRCSAPGCRLSVQWSWCRPVGVEPDTRLSGAAASLGGTTTPARGHLCVAAFYVLRLPHPGWVPLQTRQAGFEGTGAPARKAPMTDRRGGRESVGAGLAHYVAATAAARRFPTPGQARTSAAPPDIPIVAEAVAAPPGTPAW